VFLALLANAVGLFNFSGKKSETEDAIVIETEELSESESETESESESESETEAAFSLDDLSNMELSQAEALLITQGLKYSVDRTQYSDTVASGYVISTNPEAGETVRKGDTITIFVSQGAAESETETEAAVTEYKTLWDLTGYTVERAEEALEMLGLTAAYAYESSDTISEGMVTRTSAQDTDGQVPAGSTVTIYISTGSSTSSDSTDDDDNITIDSSTSTSSGTTSTASTSSDTTTGSTWQCNASLTAPSGYTGQPVRITLYQNGTETTVFEGTTTFPYLLQVTGATGVSTGIAYVYLLDEDTGEVTSKIEYSGITFSEAE
ncbi:MAG: PASTA domain-containing protein, partial [Lachnospiraceae bacterium]|nr:PASTA domain-containing protein [Lachnospiraceae bacterium]